MILFLKVTPLKFKALQTPSSVQNEMYAHPFGWFVNGSFRIVILQILAQSSKINQSSYLVALQSTFSKKTAFKSAFLFSLNFYYSDYWSQDILSMKDPFLFLQTEDADFCEVQDLLSSIIQFPFYTFCCVILLDENTSQGFLVGGWNLTSSMLREDILAVCLSVQA